MPSKRKNTEVRQVQIINAAGSLIFKYGSEHLTVRRIAAEVGISEAAIYRHFKSKKSILSFLLSNIEESLLRDLSRKASVMSRYPLIPSRKSSRLTFPRSGCAKGSPFKSLPKSLA